MKTRLNRCGLAVVAGTMLASGCTQGTDEALGQREVAAATAPLKSNNCNDEQLNIIGNGLAWAGISLLNASDDIASVRAGGDTMRFDNWFGNHCPATVDYVETVVQRAYGLLDRAEFDCGCDIPQYLRDAGVNESNAAAFVDPSRPWWVNLCPIYFSQQANGDNFLEIGAGVIVHEFTHFFGTKDARPVCQQPECDDHPAAASRAAQDATTGGSECDQRDALFVATDNADNYMYYALGWTPGTPSTLNCAGLGASQCD